MMNNVVGFYISIIKGGNWYGLTLGHVHSNVFEKHCAELLEDPKAILLQRRDKINPSVNATKVEKSV